MHRGGSFLTDLGFLFHSHVLDERFLETPERLPEKRPSQRAAARPKSRKCTSRAAARPESRKCTSRAAARSESRKVSHKKQTPDLRKQPARKWISASCFPRHAAVPTSSGISRDTILRGSKKSPATNQRRPSYRITCLWIIV